VTIDYLVSGREPATMLEHQALLYRAEAEFVAATAPFLLEGIERSEAAIAVTTKANIALLRERLGADARRVEFAEHSNWYCTATSALSGYRAFLKERLAAGAPWVRIVGEPYCEGDSDAEVRVWARYESLLNLTFSAAPVSILCPYDTRAVPDAVAAHARATHPHTLEQGERRSNPDYVDPGGFVLEQ